MLPFVLLVLFVSVAIGWVSFRAGAEAVQNLTERVVMDLLNRLGNATERHLEAAVSAMDALRDGGGAQEAGADLQDFSALEARMWMVTRLSSTIDSLFYVSNEDGRFLGVRRLSDGSAEVLLRPPEGGPLHVYSASAPGRRERLLRVEEFEPRQRTWYAVAAQAGEPVWTPLYQDDEGAGPTVALAAPVPRIDGTLAGVLAADFDLQALTAFMQQLPISSHGIAFIVDAQGAVIATSGHERPFAIASGVVRPLKVAEMDTPILRSAWSRVGAMVRSEDGGRSGPWMTHADGTDIAATRLQNGYGLDWTLVVAVPRSDFMGDVARSVAQAAFIGLVCVILAIVFGLSVLNRVLRDIRVLSEAARRVGEGEPLPALNIHRRDELGQLAASFSEMEYGLRIDKLTAVFNRASLAAQIAAHRRQLDQKPGEKPAFALLFVDLDYFKKVNDQHGHAAGDRVLVAVAARLKESVRVSDVVARYGGDEFVILLKGVTDVEDVMRMREKIRSVVEQPVRLDVITVTVGASVGWALFPEDGKDVDKLLKIADSRMYDTKRRRHAVA